MFRGKTGVARLFLGIHPIRNSGLRRKRYGSSFTLLKIRRSRSAPSGRRVLYPLRRIRRVSRNPGTTAADKEIMDAIDGTGRDDTLTYLELHAIRQISGQRRSAGRNRPAVIGLAPSAAWTAPQGPAAIWKHGEEGAGVVSPKRAADGEEAEFGRIHGVWRAED